MRVKCQVRVLHLLCLIPRSESYLISSKCIWQSLNLLYFMKL